MTVFPYTSPPFVWVVLSPVILIAKSSWGIVFNTNGGFEPLSFVLHLWHQKINAIVPCVIFSFSSFLTFLSSHSAMQSFLGQILTVILKGY
mmetsp:Transcript_13616/g.19054  ORF Transcript_13616/g.19054 Transcript_13616/m.19054 type:complete len:91 (-) Transcript_13616:43-315(-)